jgi:hypothetical protein
MIDGEEKTAIKLIIEAKEKPLFFLTKNML